MGIRKKLLGQILCDKKFLDHPQLDAALAVQGKDKHRKLGHILIELGYITADQLDEAI
ncbi:MAG: hypothetical protein H8D47_04610, partial [Planctomycetes bacterium]|nr:hypothetical protein [Planctomycetota bacterium]